MGNTVCVTGNIMASVEYYLSTLGTLFRHVFDLLTMEKGTLSPAG